MKDIENENIVAQAFSNQSIIFDELYDTNYLVSYSRKIIREEVMCVAPHGGTLLELNAGTGTDAVFFASKGLKVTATDVSHKMVEATKRKVERYGYQQLVNAHPCSFWEIDNLDNTKYDLLYSNFGGLNCTDNLNMLLPKILNKLKPGGKAVLVLMPVFCPWERIQLLRGNWNVGLRRKKGKPARAHIEGEYFNVWYYNSSYIKKAVEGSARLIRQQSLSLFVPPSDHREFNKKHPRLLRFLERLDAFFTKRWPFKNWGDYLILTLEKS